MSTRATRIPQSFRDTTAALQRLKDGTDPVRLVLPKPLSANRLYRSVAGRSIMSKEYRDWINLAAMEAMMQKRHLIKGRVGIYIELLCADKRRRDLDNHGGKAVIDLLKRIGVIEDDDSRYVRLILAKWVDTGPACVVTVKGLLE